MEVTSILNSEQPVLCIVYKVVQDISVHPTLCPDSSVPPPFLPDSPDALSDPMKLQQPSPAFGTARVCFADACGRILPPNRPLLDILGFLSRQSHRKLHLFSVPLRSYTFPFNFIILMKYRSLVSLLVLSGEGELP